MRLNGVEVPAKIIEGLRRLSSLRGPYGRLGKPQYWLRDTPAAERLLEPGLDFDWMLDDDTEYFNCEELIKENDGLSLALQAEDGWLRGAPDCGFGVTPVDPSRIVFTGFNLLADNFFGLYQTAERLALIAMCTRNGVWGWDLVYDDVTDFLLDARVHAIPNSSLI